MILAHYSNVYGCNQGIFSLILTASRDGTVKLWNLAGDKIASLDGHTDSVNLAVFNPAGDMVLTASSDGTAKLWRIYPTMQSKVDVAQERLSRGFTDAECDRFFSEDRASCPQTIEAVFALFDEIWLSKMNSDDWFTLAE